MNEEVLQIFKALADKTRLQIVEYLAKDDLTTNDLTERLQMSQPTVFHHMKILKEARVVEVCSSVNPARYRLCYPGLDLTLQQLLAGDPDGRDLSQLRREYEIQRYKESVRTKDGRWTLYLADRYTAYVIEEILAAVEEDRYYSEWELQHALEKVCVDTDDVMGKLLFGGFIKSEIKWLPNEGTGGCRKLVYYKTGKNPVKFH